MVVGVTASVLFYSLWHVMLWYKGCSFELMLLHSA